MAMQWVSPSVESKKTIPGVGACFSPLVYLLYCLCFSCFGLFLVFCGFFMKFHEFCLVLFPAAFCFFVKYIYYMYIFIYIYFL